VNDLHWDMTLILPAYGPCATPLPNEHVAYLIVQQILHRKPFHFKHLFICKSCSKRYQPRAPCPGRSTPLFR